MKKSFNSFTHIFFLVSAILLFSFCSEKLTTEPNPTIFSQRQLAKVGEKETTAVPKSAASNIGKKDSTKIKIGKSSGVVPMLPVCDKLYYQLYELDYYHAAPGKIVGIWPTEERWSNVSRLTQLKNLWGFNYIFIQPGCTPTYCSYENVYAAGYRPSNILCGGIDVVNGGYITDIQRRPTFWGYYTDEPVTNHGVSGIYGMNTTYSWFQLNYPNSKFIAGETVPGNANLISAFTTDLMCTRYCADGDYLCTKPDQRPLWTDFRNLLGTKFSMTWIGAHKDLSQYDDLLGHARNLGLAGVWLFQAMDNTDVYSDNNISTFALNAWKWGWLRRFEKEWFYTYQCSKPNPCDCNKNNLGDGWVLQSRQATGRTREVTY